MFSRMCYKLVRTYDQETGMWANLKISFLHVVSYACDRLSCGGGDAEKVTRSRKCAPGLLRHCARIALRLLVDCFRIHFGLSSDCPGLLTDCFRTAPIILLGCRRSAIILLSGRRRIVLDGPGLVLPDCSRMASELF